MRCSSAWASSLAAVIIGLNGYLLYEIFLGG